MKYYQLDELIINKDGEVYCEDDSFVLNTIKLEFLNELYLKNTNEEIIIWFAEDNSYFIERDNEFHHFEDIGDLNYFFTEEYNNNNIYKRINYSEAPLF